MWRLLTPVAVLLYVFAALIVWKVLRHDETTPRRTVTALHQRVHVKARHVPKAHAAPAQISGHVNTRAAIALVPTLSTWEIASGDATLFTRTDANGAWTIDHVPPGRYAATAAAPGMLPASLGIISIAPGERRTGIDFQLLPGGTPVRGTVRDFRGNPIAGVRVTATVVRESAEARAPALAFSDVDGKFELSVSDNVEYSFYAHHDNYTPKRKTIDIGMQQTVDFELLPGATIQGVVVSRATGEPVADALVSAEWLRGWEWRGEATADSEGKFVLTGVPPGAISLAASAPDYASAQPTRVGVGLGERVARVRLVVDDAVSIVGRVVDKATHKGIAGATVGANRLGGAAARSQPTGADGAFEITGVRHGSYNLFADAENKISVTGKDIDVADQDVIDVTIEMETGATLAGRLVPPSKGSIRIAMQSDNGYTSGFEGVPDAVKISMVRGVSDAGGNWKLEHVPSGRFIVFATTTDGSSGALPVVADRDRTNLEIPVVKRGSISGRVIDTKGSPLVGLKVVAIPQGHARAAEECAAITGADGSFKIVGVEAGKYRIRSSDMVDRLMTINEKKPPETIEVAAGSEKTDVIVTLEARDSVISGVVTAAGKPAPDAWVTAHIELKVGVEPLPRSIGNSEPVLTDADGEFVIEHLHAGTYTVIVDGPRGVSRGEKANVKIGEPTAIQLQSFGSLTGRVMADSAPVKSYDLKCEGPEGPADRIERYVDATNGAFAVDDLPPGHYRCSATNDEGNAAGEIDVTTGAAMLDLSLVPWSTVTGTVLSLIDFKPVPHMHAEAYAESGVEYKTTPHKAMAMTSGNADETDAAGHFTITRVANGRGYVSVWGPTIVYPMVSMGYRILSPGTRIDLPRMWVVPPPRERDAGTLGMTITATARGLEVSAIAPDGPAALSGIVVGDTITEIQRVSVRELTPTITRQLAAGNVSAGTTIWFTLGRGKMLYVTAAKW